jgi:hypothetical protein
MAFAHAVGWFNTRVLLSVTYFIVLAIPAVIVRLVRKDILKKGWNSGGGTYWVTKEKINHSIEDAKRQF